MEVKKTAIIKFILRYDDVRRREEKHNLIYSMMTSDDVPIDVFVTGENLLDAKKHRSEFQNFEFHARNVMARLAGKYFNKRCNWKRHI